MFGRRDRIVQAPRPRLDTHDGLAYALWTPSERPPPPAGVVVVHGAGSVKESHYDFARAALALGLGVLVFDQRGHGESGGELDGRAVTDVTAMVALLGSALTPGAPVALRGSSLGGYLALRAAAPASAAAVIAISPAWPDGLRRALDNPELPWRTDRASVLALLGEADLSATVADLAVPVLCMHATGDEQVPVARSRELAAAWRSGDSRLIEVPGGHHRSVQHDEELQAVSLRWLTGVLERRSASGDPSGRDGDRG